MWFLYALISAFSVATSDAFAKLAMRKAGINEFFIIWLRYIFAAAFLTPFLLTVQIPHLSSRFFMWHLLWIPTESVGLYLSLKALRISPISLVGPIMALTPMFILFTGWIALGEVPSMSKVPGIFLIIFGSFILGTGRTRIPFGRMIHEKGARLMTATAFLYSLSAVAGKGMVIETGPIFFGIYYAIVMLIVFTPLGIANIGGDIRKAKFELLMAGLFFAFTIVSHMMAVKDANVAYMIAIKRLSGVFSVIWGAVLFKEQEIGSRLLGATIMVLGAFIIAVA